jgi:hypothetical protein
MVVDTDRLHRLAQGREIALEAQGRDFPKVADIQGPSESGEDPGGPL